MYSKYIDQITADFQTQLFFRMTIYGRQRRRRGTMRWTIKTSGQAQQCPTIFWIFRFVLQFSGYSGLSYNFLDIQVCTTIFWIFRIVLQSSGYSGVSYNLLDIQVCPTLFWILRFVLHSSGYSGLSCNLLDNQVCPAIFCINRCVQLFWIYRLV